MIKAQSAKRQTLRFQGMPFWDQKRPELENAYREAFESDFDAEEFTREWLMSGRECPLPADVWESARRGAAKKREEQTRTGFKCEICKDLRFIAADDRRDGSIGFARRCICNPDTDESSLRGHYSHRNEREYANPHPEVALGIPAIIVSATPRYKAFMAKRCNYAGPLTIAQAVEHGVVERSNAIGMVKYWLQEGGEKPTADRLLETL